MQNIIIYMYRLKNRINVFDEYEIYDNLLNKYNNINQEELNLLKNEKNLCFFKLISYSFHFWALS